MKNKAFIYPAARARVNQIAKTVASFIDFLHEVKGLNYKMVTLVGFSLGAQIAGLAGKKTKEKLDRIVGLDPAGVLFDVNDVESRLSPESSTYTECIHTGFFFGIREPICHVDFYVNSGSNQPGCAEGVKSVPCSHARVIDIYHESLENPKAFYGNRCQDLESALNQNCTGEPGAFINDPENEVNNLSGIFHVTTNAQSPFGKGPA